MSAIRRNLRRFGRDQRGVAAIEFGMIAPIFFAMLIGLMDIGRYMWTLNTMQYAIDQAVRAGVVQQMTDEDVTDLVKKSVPGLDAGAINVAVDSSGSSLSITANMNYAFMFPISAVVNSTTISLRTEMPK